MLRVIVLGAGAGGGFPQWNCNCCNCDLARRGRATPLTQSSLAVTTDDRNWFLLNASPDLRQQIAVTPDLHPGGGLRHSPIAGVVLTNADVDHVAGLLSLREGQRLSIYATARVHLALRANPIFGVLDPALVPRRDLRLKAPERLHGPDGEDCGLEIEAFPVPGKVALWLEDPAAKGFGSEPEDTVGLAVRARDGSGTFFYIPGCAEMTPDLADRLYDADLVFFDGTTFADDELIAAGLGTKTAARMGHMSMGGAYGSLAAFAGLAVARKVFVHVNNSNPALVAGSRERATIEAAGWELAQDGMEFRS